MTTRKGHLSHVEISVAASGNAFRSGRGLVNRSSSPYVRLRSVDMGDVQWTQGFWAEKFDRCAQVIVPNMWQLISSTEISFAYQNFLIAIGQAEGEHRGPKWNDGDFYKWLEAAAYVYGITKDPTLDRLMDEIIEVIGKAQRADGYIHTPVIIEQRQGKREAREFNERVEDSRAACNNSPVCLNTPGPTTKSRKTWRRSTPSARKGNGAC